MTDYIHRICHRENSEDATAVMNHLTVLSFVLVFSIPKAEFKSVDKIQLKHGDVRSMVNQGSRHKRQLSATEKPSILQLQHDYNIDSQCRTIYESDKEALLAIQEATQAILKVIDKMDIESRPSAPVSAFIKFPEHPKVDEDGMPTKMLANQLINKAGFTISYDDRRSLERIKAAAEKIKTKLLHLDLGERSTRPQPAANWTNRAKNASTNYRKKRNTRPHHRQSRAGGSRRKHAKPSASPLQQSVTNSDASDIYSLPLKNNNCEDATKNIENLQLHVNALHNKIDDIGRKIREEYIDNSNLERTDIKSSSDNLKKLQGMISATNYTILAELLKIFEEQSKAHQHFEKQFDTLETLLMKLYLASADKTLDKTVLSREARRVAKTINELRDEDKDGNKEEQDHVDDDDYNDDDDDDK